MNSEDQKTAKITVIKSVTVVNNLTDKERILKPSADKEIYINFSKEHPGLLLVNQYPYGDTVSFQALGRFTNHSVTGFVFEDVEVPVEIANKYKKDAK